MSQLLSSEPTVVRTQYRRLLSGPQRMMFAMCANYKRCQAAPSLLSTVSDMAPRGVVKHDYK